MVLFFLFVATLQTAGERCWEGVFPALQASSSPRKPGSHPSPRKTGAVWGPQARCYIDKRITET